jgi:Rieske Fe-S protein
LNFNDEISRKRFIKILGAFLVLPFAGAWYVMTGKVASRNASSLKYVHLDDIPQGTAIQQEMITYRNGNDIKFFSTRCSHLGCRIDKKIGNELVCPCHGSRFDPETGNLLKGPADEGLRELEFTVKENSYIVKLER